MPAIWTRDAADGIALRYTSDGFSHDPTLNSRAGKLHTNWDEILWSAITVGRPNRYAVFQHSSNSMFEAIFRWSLIRMAISEFIDPDNHEHCLFRTDAARTLDPSEKGAVNYFVGMTFCKLFAWRMLQTPWLLHLDTFGSQLHAVLCSNQRPDLIGESLVGDWFAFESKGRGSWSSGPDRIAAKQQSTRIVSIDSVPPRCGIAALTYFRDERLRFYWQDPPINPNPEMSLPDLKLGDDVWQHYYLPALQFYNAQTTEIPDLALPYIAILSIQPNVLKYLQIGQWRMREGTAKKTVNNSKATNTSQTVYKSKHIRNGLHHAT